MDIYTLKKRLIDLPGEIYYQATNVAEASKSVKLLNSRFEEESSSKLAALYKAGVKPQHLLKSIIASDAYLSKLRNEIIDAENKLDMEKAKLKSLEVEYQCMLELARIIRTELSVTKEYNV